MGKLEMTKESSSESLFVDERISLTELKSEVLDANADGKSKKEFTVEEMKKTITTLNKMVQDLDNMKFNQDTIRGTVSNFIKFEIPSENIKMAREAIWNKTFETIKAISKKSAPYEKLSYSQKIEITKLAWLMECTALSYDIYKNRKYEAGKGTYNLLKSKLEAQVNKMK